jgi:outer membrane protein, heavy metal efflux system
MTTAVSWRAEHNVSRPLRRPRAYSVTFQSRLIASLIWLLASAVPAKLVAQTSSFAAPEQSVAAAPLSLKEAVALAREQPALSAFEREAVASEQAAIAAGTLPDPQLTAGIQDFPVTGRKAFSPTADDFTMYTIGIMREQVRRSKREAETARLTAEAVVSRAQATALERRIQRNVMIAWINAVEARAKQRLLNRLVADLEVGQRILEAGIPTGASSPSLALQAQAEVALAKAQREEALGQEARARSELARWIGAEARQPLPDTLPVLEAPMASLALLAQHPDVLAAGAQERAALRAVDVARADRRPNLSWSVMYGYRPDYGDMVTATVSIPLQINRNRLQSGRISEAAARADAARLRAEDARRELGGSYGTAVADYKSAEAQLVVLRTQAIPSLEASFAAAEARYGAGQGTLDIPLTIVRRYVETTIQSVEQQGRRARAAAELIYLTRDASQ